MVKYLVLYGMLKINLLIYFKVFCIFKVKKSRENSIIWYYVVLNEIWNEWLKEFLIRF